MTLFCIMQSNAVMFPLRRRKAFRLSRASVISKGITHRLVFYAMVISGESESDAILKKTVEMECNSP